MTNHDLSALIRQLHEELATAPTLDPATREELSLLAADLERTRATSESEKGTGLRARLGQGVKRLEASHPALSRTLANLIDALALYGL
jgi:hypothetical protein